MCAAFPGLSGVIVTIVLSPQSNHGEVSLCYTGLCPRGVALPATLVQATIENAKATHTHRDTHTYTHRHTQRYTQTHIQTHRYTGTHARTHKHTQTHTQTHTQIHTQIHRHT